MVTKKIKAVKDNKSPGVDHVDGILPKLLMETIEQISIPLARHKSVQHGSRKREWFLFIEKKQTSYHYLKRV